jgi:hypothetical protein
VSYATCTGCPVCGNGIKETGENCDGADLGGQTCVTQGFGSGTLRCKTDCSGLDTSRCSVCNLSGTCDQGENCTSCPNECAKSGPVCGNRVCETANGENCVNCPSDCAGVQTGKPGNRYCCGGGGGTNPIGCGDARCMASPRSCTTVRTPIFCCGNGSCEGGETSYCALDCGP